MHKLAIYFFFFGLLLGCSTSDQIEEPDMEPQENIFDGNIWLQTQQEVDDFGAEQYTVVTGYVWIAGEDIVSLAPLNTLIHVDRFIIEFSPGLTSLEGLNSVEQVRSISIHYCDGLTSLSGLEGLTTIKPLDFSTSNFSWISLFKNSNLASIAALSNLTYAQGIRITTNNALTSLDGLQNVAEMNGVYPDTTPGVIIGGSILVNSENEGNLSLTDFCALTTLFSNGSFNPDWYYYGENAYNPSFEDIINGDCSL